jgi:hypothetical protein
LIADQGKSPSSEKKLLSLEFSAFFSQNKQSSALHWIIEPSEPSVDCEIQWTKPDDFDVETRREGNGDRVSLTHSPDHDGTGPMESLTEIDASH